MVMLTADEGLGELASEVLDELTWWSTLQEEADARRAATTDLSLRMLDEHGGVHEMHRLAMDSANVSSATRARIGRTLAAAISVIRELMSVVLAQSEVIKQYEAAEQKRIDSGGRALRLVPGRDSQRSA